MKMNNDQEKYFVYLWQKQMLNVDKQTPKHKVDSLRFCLPQFTYLKETNSGFEEEWSLETKELEARKSYSALLDSKTCVNNYAEAILSLNKGFKTENKKWKCGLDLRDLQKYISDEEIPEDFKNEYEKLGTCLKIAVSKKPPSSLQFNHGNSSFNCKVNDGAPNFDIIDNCNLFENENKKASNFTQPVPKTQSFPSSELDTGSSFFTHIGSSQKGVSLDTKIPFHEHSFVAGQNAHYYNSTETSWGESQKKPFKEQMKQHYPWHTLKDNEESSKCTSFKTASHQLVLENCKKYGVGRGSVKDLYGNPKRSLGTRGIKSRFIPPIRREEEEETRRNSYGYCLDGRAAEWGPHSELMMDERLKNIDAKMVELIMNEIMDSGPLVTWDDIAGLQLAKSTIQEIVVWPMLRPDIFTGLRGPPKGILLFGPPGTGKTMIGRCIASQSHSTFFSISASSLTSKWVGEGEKMVRAMFAVARCHQPAVIFIDEIDSLLTQRSNTEHESSRRIKTEFLVQLDGATSSDDDRLLVVGATNRPQELDEAARRRLVKRLYIPLPDTTAREQIIKNLLANQSHSLSSNDMKEISVKTEGYSGADMANLCREAALGPIRSIKFTDIQHIAVEQVRPISAEDFDAALHAIRASVSDHDLSLYEEWNKKYGINTRS